jgi:hypothetical protein
VSPIDEYKAALDRLHALGLAGRLDEADALCETLDPVWYKMTAAEQEECRAYAAGLNAELDK